SAALEVPLPRRAPARPTPAVEAPAAIAMADSQSPRAVPFARERLNTLFDSAFPVHEGVDPPRRLAANRAGTLHEVDFDAAYGRAAPPVPPMLAKAMAARDQSGREQIRYQQLASASIPIAPTAIVATVDVTRRAATMTAAAFSGSGDKPASVGASPAV